jgi:tetratricopeptide (TPR) repeat protein
MREAIKALKEAVRINPEAADTHHYLGLAYYQTNQFEEALAEFEKAVALDDEDPDYHYNLANTSYDLGTLKGPPKNGPLPSNCAR